MASSARIDELRKKFDENPRRYFAPLANEYRKAGELEQAISICREYLPQQPGHMSGHIVYGQALFEKSRFDESRHVFETALSLDPENLIALRHLGDIARQAGDTRGARAWYQRVLEADPRNEEIAALMTSLLAPPRVSQPTMSTVEEDFSPADPFAVPGDPDLHVEKTQKFAVGSELGGASAHGAHDGQPQRLSDHELLDLADLTIATSLSEPRPPVDVPAHVEGAGKAALAESSSANAN
ncbi:MAG TPA: tetratricopeptide repeat protein, partial [Gemmatimonadaceae bacterium]